MIYIKVHCAGETGKTMKKIMEDNWLCSGDSNSQKQGMS
jgi:hypothetical protein